MVRNTAFLVQTVAMKSLAIRLAVFAALAALGTGCAGAKVSESRQIGQPVNQRPTQIVVYPFAINPDEVTLNQSIVQKVYRGMSGSNVTQQQADLGHQTAQNLCIQIAADLSQKGMPAACQPRGTPVPDDALIIDGFFMDISEGNRLRRLAIGFGVGASTLGANIDVYQRVDYISHEVLQFETYADSGNMPGFAVTGTPGLAIGGTAAIASTAANVAARRENLHRVDRGARFRHGEADRGRDSVVLW
jgi:hypothetical protein